MPACSRHRVPRSQLCATSSTQSVGKPWPELSQVNLRDRSLRSWTSATTALAPLDGSAASSSTGSPTTRSRSPSTTAASRDRPARPISESAPHSPGPSDGGSVRVTVVEVRHMGVGVLDGIVTMPVNVPSNPTGHVLVVVVCVVVAVLVFVLDHRVEMHVLVGGVQRERDADGGERNGEGLDDGDGLAEQGPGQHGADERGRGEDDLAAGGAEITCTLDPQGDRGAVAERADRGARRRSGRSRRAMRSRRRCRERGWRCRRRHLW